MADPALADVMTSLDALHTEMRNSFMAARAETEALRRELEANTASIRTDLGKQLAPMLQTIKQLTAQ